jgi:PHP family Zn ribbon phosphoesterase
MSLAKASLKGTDWQFGSELTTENVWDAFVIVSLIEEKLRAHQRLYVPHTGAQKDRFKEAMAARNKDIVLNGQPDAVGHACDKCFRRYETEDGEIGEFNQICTMILLIRRP